MVRPATPRLKDWLLQICPLVLVCLALFWPGERTIPAIDRDEARFAQASRQMAASGDIVDIRFQDETRYKKPAGIYWLQAASAKLLGEDTDNPIWPYRLPSLLGAIGAVLAIFALGRAMCQSRVAWASALLLAASLLLNVEARLATVDACLLCCCTLWLACLYPIWTDEASPWVLGIARLRHSVERPGIAGSGCTYPTGALYPEAWLAMAGAGMAGLRHSSDDGHRAALAGSHCPAQP